MLDIKQEKNILLPRYLERVARMSKIRGTISKTHMNFRCPVCGDSITNQYVSSAGFVYHKDHWTFKCFRTACPASSGIGAEKFLKEYFPEIFKEFREDLRTYLGRNEETRKENIERMKRDVEEAIRQKDVLRKQAEKKYLPYFKRLNKENFSNEELAKFVKFMKSRQIPKKYIKDIMGAKFIDKFENYFYNRIIFICKDENDKPVYWQGRILDPIAGHIPRKSDNQKYFNRAISKKGCFWGLNYINKLKPVIVCEGIITAMSCENGLSTLGSNITEEQFEVLNTLNCVYCLDDDEAGKKTTRSLVMKNKPCLSWRKLKKDYPEFKGTDLNDFKCYTNEEVTFDFLKPYIVNNFICADEFK